MTLINILFFGILPAGLLMWIGNEIRSRGGDKAEKRWLLFLLGGLGLSAVAFIIAMSISEYVFNLSIPALLPILFGFTAALILHFARQRNISSVTATLLSLAILLSLSRIALSNNWMILWLILMIGALTALVWSVWDQKGNYYVLLFILEVLLLGISIRLADAYRIMGLYLVAPLAGIVLSALLLRRLLSGDQPFNWQRISSTLLMVVVLLLLMGYQAMLVSMWDVATDGLGWVFLMFIASTVGIGSAMLMTWSMPRRHIWAAVLFALTVPAILVGAFNLANYDQDHKWGTKPILTTERRADMIDTAIQRYYEKNHAYPQTLNELTPLYLLYIPNPFIIPKQNWCYEGGVDHYRFGYVYRASFSSPASVKIHSSAGEPSDENWGCQDEADKIPGPPF